MTTDAQLLSRWTKPAAPLSERAELATAAWFDLVRTFFVGVKSNLSGVQFSFSAEFTDPPPHVSSDVSCGFTVTIRNNDVVLHEQPNSDADFYLKADYNVALLYVSRILGDDATSDQRVLSEFARLTKDKPPIVSGQLPANMAGTVLRDLHNFIARRTVNNPDVEHRIEHLGLSSNARDLDEHGYTVLADAFSSAYADALREETQHNHSNAPPDTGFRATMLLRRGRLWEEAVVHPWVLTLMEYLLGRGCLLYQSDTIVKGPGLDTHPGLHADYGASRITEPFPEYCVEATSIWAIDEFSLENGPTVMMPGSFKERRQVPKGMTRDGTKPILMSKGSIALWHGGVWHGALPRTAPGTRTSLHNAYCRHFLRPLECYYDIPQEIIDRNSPAFSTLCGVDDALGKSGLHGADFERMRYAAKAGFGELKLPG